MFVANELMNSAQVRLSVPCMLFSALQLNPLLAPRAGLHPAKRLLWRKVRLRPLPASEPSRAYVSGCACTWCRQATVAEALELQSVESSHSWRIEFKVQSYLAASLISLSRMGRKPLISLATESNYM